MAAKRHEQIKQEATVESKTEMIIPTASAPAPIEDDLPEIQVGLDPEIPGDKKEAPKAPVAPPAVTDQILEATSTGIPANMDPHKAAKLKAGWVVLWPNKPMLPPDAAMEFFTNFDPRTTDLDLSLMEGHVQYLRTPVEQKPEVPVKVKDSPFKSRAAWLPYAPVKSGDLDNAWNLKMRLGMDFNSNSNKPKEWKKNLVIQSTEAVISNKMFIRLGVLFDNALFRKPYTLKINPEWCYGHKVGSARYDHGFELIDQQVFDLDGEAAILIRCTGTDADHRGGPLWLKADDSPYIADIQFTSDPMAK